MADLKADYRLILKSELEIRKKKNSRFSLRAFAKILGVDPSFLSKINSGKLILSVDLAAEMAKKMKLSSEDRRKFILSAAEEQRCHALYLLDPSLTECDPALESTNRLPRVRKRQTRF